MGDFSSLKVNVIHVIEIMPRTYKNGLTYQLLPLTHTSRNLVQVISWWYFNQVGTLFINVDGPILRVTYQVN